MWLGYNGTRDEHRIMWRCSKFRDSTHPSIPHVVALQRVGDAYAAGAFPIAEFLARSTPLDDRIAELKHRLNEQEMLERQNRDRERMLQFLRDNARFIPDWLRDGDKQAINHQLRSVILEAVIYEGNQVSLKWR